MTARWFIALSILAVPSDALPQLAQLCPADARTAGRATLHNEGKRTLGEIFGLLRRRRHRVRHLGLEQPARRPRLAHRGRLRRARSLAPQVIWAEAADLRSDTFSVALKRADGGSARLTVSGNQICVRDGSGDQWFFRNVSDDTRSD